MTEQEFNIYVLRVRQRLVRFAEGFSTAGAATAEDMVQDAMLKIWKLNCSGVQIRNEEAFSITVIKNICLDYIKLKKNSTERIESVKCWGICDAETSTPLHTLEIKERLGQVKEYIKTLPIDQQVVLRLRDVMGYEMEEIAKILDTSEGNIRTLLSRARGKIRGYLVGV